MAKTNRQAHIRSAKRQRRGKTNKLVIAWMLSPRRLVGATLALMTIAGTYYLFKSKVSLQPESPLKSDFVLDTPFLLSNESVLPIYQYQTGGVVDRKTPVSYNTKTENAI